MPIKINGATSGSTTIAAPDTGSDETIELSTALASKADKANGYQIASIIYYTSNGSFQKSLYPNARALIVKCVGAGGGGGGAATTGAGEVAAGTGGGGGAYAESFITDIAGLSASVTVTVGAGGAGGAAGANNGSDGGDSSFGALVVAKGGGGGVQGPANPTPTMGNGSAVGGSGASSVGDLKFSGGNSNTAHNNSASFPARPLTGTSLLAGSVGNDIISAGVNGSTGLSYGGGGAGGINAQNQATARAGGTGGAGIVIVEVYA